MTATPPAPPRPGASYGAIFAVAQNFQAALLSELALTPGGEPARNLLAFGGVAIDECCSDEGDGGGMSWVTFARLYPTSRFPVEDNTMQPTVMRQLACDFQIGVVRCYPSLTDDSDPTPPAEAIAAASLVAMADASALACAVIGTIAAEPIDEEALMGQVVTYGPEGGCAGSVATVTVNMTATAGL